MSSKYNGKIKKMPDGGVLEGNLIKVRLTGYGKLHSICALLLFLLGNNYQNNLVIGIACVMISLVPLCYFWSKANLSGIAVKPVAPPNGFVGQSFRAGLRMESANRRMAIAASSSQFGSVPGEIDILEGTEETAVVFHPAARGRFSAGIIDIASCHPLNIWQAKAEIDFCQECIAYPKPIAGRFRMTESGCEQSERTASSYAPGQPGIDELSGLRPYREGEPPSLIDWKRAAMGRGLLAKDFAASAGDDEYLDLLGTDGPLEERLSVLCQAACTYSSMSKKFGLRLGITEIPPASGDAHLEKVLTALANYRE